MILNIKLIKDESDITLKQSHYVEKFLDWLVFMDRKSSPISYDPK